MKKTLKEVLLDVSANAVLKNLVLEKLLLIICRSPRLRRVSRAGAVALRIPSRLSNHLMKEVLIDGYQIKVNLAEIAGVYAYFFGEHNEGFSADLVKRLLGRNDTFLDVGANRGSYTFLAARCNAPDGKVFSFEPNPELSKILTAALTKNLLTDRVTLDSRALFNETGRRLKFYVSQSVHNSGTSSLVYHGVNINSEIYTEVETLRLDDFFVEQKLDRVRMLKLDVERAEEYVIAGADKVLKSGRIEYLLVEMHAGDRCERMLRDSDYSSWYVDERNRRVVPSINVKSGLFGNFLFAHSKMKFEVESTLVED